MAAPVKRVPGVSRVCPALSSPPAGRTHWPDGGGTRMITSSPSAAQSSCMTMLSAPAGSAAPVKMRAALPSGSTPGASPAAARRRTGRRVPGAGTSAARTA